MKKYSDHIKFIGLTAIAFLLITMCILIVGNQDKLICINEPAEVVLVPTEVDASFKQEVIPIVTPTAVPSPVLTEAVEELPAEYLEPSTSPYIEEATPAPAAADELEYLGEFKITEYSSCSICCGKYANNRPKDENGEEIVHQKETDACGSWNSDCRGLRLWQMLNGSR